MSGARIADRARLLLLLGRSRLRNLAARLSAHPVLPWQLFRSKADRLVIAPQDLRTADATLASEFYAGRFVFAGKVVICDGRSPFEMAAPSEEWARALLSFGWLRHLRAAESGITRANARALVDEWISLQGSWHPVAWRPEVLSRRVMAWLSQATLILHDADVQFYRRFLRCLTRQVRYLRLTAPEAPDGAPRLQAMVALTYATLCMAGQSKHLKRTIKRLTTEIERQILPDGGHISRNPSAVIDLLLDLLPLRQAFAARNVPPPQALLNALDRMMPMLRFFRHGDGSFALFNGMGITAPDLIATLLAYDDTRGAPPSAAPHSGYQRLEGADLLVIADVGRPPPLAMSQDAHAGCLAFELSAGLQRIVVNCGVPATNRESWRQVARSTAAHATVTFNDTSSCRTLDSGPLQRFFGSPIISGPRKVTLAREDRPDSIVLRASHDGYYDRFRIVHERSLKLAADGSRLDGEDAFKSGDGGTLPSGTQDEFAVRFHLHPAIGAEPLADGHGVALTLPHGERLTFDAYEDRVEIEESVFLAGPEGPRRTVQLVIYGRARKVPHVRWSFTRGGGASEPGQGEQTE